MYASIPTFRREPDGSITVNPMKDYAVPFELGTDRPNQIVTLAAGQQNLGVPMTARHDGPIELFALKAIVLDDNGDPVTNHNVRVEFEHPGKRKRFQNRPIHLRTIQGDGGRPYVLPETIWLPAIQALFVTFHNDDAAERNVELVFDGIKYYPHAAPQTLKGEIYSYTERRERTYCYWQTTDEAVTLAASQEGAQAFWTTPDDADLEVFKRTVVSDAAFRVEMRDGSTDRTFNSARQHSSLFFGGFDATAIGFGAGGIFPQRVPTTLLVRRSVKMLFVMDNLSAAPNDVFITLGGRKVSYV